MRITHPKWRYGIDWTEAKVSMARAGNGVVVVGTPTNRKGTVKVWADRCVMQGQAKAVMECGTDVNHAVNRKQAISKLSVVFVPDTFHLRVAAIGRMNGDEMRLQKRDEFLRCFYRLRETHGVERPFIV
jgi:hypothetical protein